MTDRIIRLPGYRLDKAGKLVREVKRLPLPARLARQKKVTVKRGTV